MMSQLLLQFHLRPIRPLYSISLHRVQAMVRQGAYLPQEFAEERHEALLEHNSPLASLGDTQLT